MAFDALTRRVEKTIGRKAAPGQAIVAAIVVRKGRGKRLGFEARDASDRAIERHPREVVGRQAPAIRAQRVGVRVPPVAERGGRGELSDGKGGDTSRHASSDPARRREYDIGCLLGRMGARWAFMLRWKLSKFRWA